MGALLAGSLFAQTEINGIKISEGKDFDNYHFYRIRNMRAMRFDYTNGVLKNMAGDSIDRNNDGFYMAETLPDGTPTPKIADHPYMGLSQLGGNWWASFANDAEEIQSPLTEYWYFTADSNVPGKVMIKNAVIHGTLSATPKNTQDLAGYHRSSIDFNTKNNYYYVLPVKPALEAAAHNDENPIESILQYLSEDDLNMAFAFSQKDMISAEPGYANQCLSMNDYVTVKKREEMPNEEADGKPIYSYYGFAGLDLTGSPVVADSKGNYGSNGSIFILEPVDATEVVIAKQEYDNLVGWDHRCYDQLLYPITDAINYINGWHNLPALFNESAIAKLTEIRTWLNNLFDESSEALKAASDADTRREIAQSIEENVKNKINEAAALVGNGCTVRFQNQLSLKDIDSFVNGNQEANEKLQLGNAYIAAGGSPTFKYGGNVYSMDNDDDFADFAHSGIEPRLEADENCEWELIPVANTATFLLYNKANNCYIRKYHDLYDYAGGKESFSLDESQVSEISWMTTTDQKDAAPFTFIGCPDEDMQTEPSELILGLIENAGLDCGIENKVRLQARYSETNGPETFDYTYHIHRGSKSSEYRFINWGFSFNNWFADNNAFLIESVEMGSISELAADKPAQATGIYDLQGRRVNRPGHGLYIINGHKTLIK